MPAGGDATVRFTHRFQSPGNHAICVRAAGDRLDVDNSRWLVVPVREEVRVLCVAGREGAAKYVADALNPNPAGDSPIRPIVVSEGDLADVDARRFRLRLPLQRRPAHRRAKPSDSLATQPAGGGVVFFLGDRVVPESYNARLRQAKSSLSSRPHRPTSSPNRSSASIRSTIAIRSSPRSAAASGPAC